MSNNKAIGTEDSLSVQLFHLFLAFEIYNVIRSLQTDNPEERADERGYVLQ